MTTVSNCTLVFEFKVGSGTDAERAARAQDCLTELNAQVPPADRQRWSMGIPGPNPGTDIIDWINASVLAGGSLEVRRTSINDSPRYCIIWDGANEIIVCYYDFWVAYKSGPKAGQLFEVVCSGTIVPISLRFTNPMPWSSTSGGSILLRV